MSPKLFKTLCDALNISDERGNRVVSDVYNRVNVVGDVGSKSVYRIAVDVVADMERLSIRADKVKQYQLWAFAPILFWFSAHRKDDYGSELLAELEAAVKAAHSLGKFSYNSYCVFLQGTEIFKKYFERGALQANDIPVRIEHTLGTSFQLLIDLYREKHGDYSSLSVNTVDCQLSAARMFLYYLEQQSITTVEEFSHKIISESITLFADSYDSGLKSTLGSIRAFLSFLHKADVTAVDYSKAVPRGVPKRHKIKYGFSNDEVTAILDAVNRDKIIGKRDYAMMLIAARTGLRACDIAALKFADIDWRTNEIRIVQQKTGVSLTLPLSPEVGNAIADYILNARPESGARQIFLQYHKPYEPVKQETVGMAVTQHSARVGAVNPITPNRRAHAFRRGFAMNLLGSQITNDMLIEMLGQVEPNSSKPYLAIDENRLKDCAITLASVKLEGAE